MKNGADLDQQFKIALKASKLELGIFLSYYFKKDGAVAENCELVGSIDYLEDNKGKFTVAFDLVHYNACLNIHDNHKDQMEINFVVEKGLQKIKLIGPYWPERELDDI